MSWDEVKENPEVKQRRWENWRPGGGECGIRCPVEAEWKRGRGHETESLGLPGGPPRGAWACLQRKLWGHVCVQKLC